MVPGNEEISGEFISFTSCVLIEVAWASVYYILVYFV